MGARARFLVFIAFASCGGATVAGSADNHDGGVGSAGAGTGSGTTTQAGGTGGMSMGTGGSSTTMLDPICLLPNDSGNCDAAFPSYWHNPETGVCEPFIYGGCGGNANRFAALDACQKACRGGTPDMDACSSPGDCLIAQANCCASCGSVTAQSFVAVNRASEGPYTFARGCDLVDCPGCPEPSQSSREFFTATCQAGQCVVIDVRQTDLTKCVDNTDCVLRSGLECCERCDGAHWVALNAKADLRALVCGADPPGCPACVAPEPLNDRPRCTAGRCEVWFDINGPL
jgi:Kunitz/Bovine pancreatic trypsin inhibitor domain